MGVHRGQRRTPALVYVGAVLLCIVPLSTISARGQDEAVLNPAVEVHLSDWRAACDDGRLAFDRVAVDQGPQGVSTAVDLRHPGGTREWCRVLVGLRDPEDFFEAGHVYRMRAYVRDVTASGRSGGILLANGAFAHRPTEETRYRSFTDDAWHLLERTFVAGRGADDDTALYIELPTEGRLHWQITAVSVRAVELPRPTVLPGRAAPVTRMTFDGPGGRVPDDGLWGYEVGDTGRGSDEVQVFTGRPTNAALDGQGSLILTARRDAGTGPDGTGAEYSSARLTTVDRFVAPSGSYVEAVLRVPAGDGIRPTFSLVGANVSEVGWPACGVLEVMGGVRGDASAVRHRMHFPRTTDLRSDVPYGEDVDGGDTVLSTPRDEEFHRYGVYFDDDVVQFYVDRRPRLTLTRQEAWERGRTWPFGQPQFLSLQMSLAEGVETSDLPASMVIAEIAIWEGGVPVALS